MKRLLKKLRLSSNVLKLFSNTLSGKVTLLTSLFGKKVVDLVPVAPKFEAHKFRSEYFEFVTAELINLFV